MADMSALLSALKRKESAPEIDDTAAPDPTSPAVPAPAEDEPPEDEAAQEKIDAKVGELLATQNPALYAKLSKQASTMVDQPDDSAPAAPADGMMS